MTKIAWAVLLVFFVALTQPLAFGQPDDVESMLDRAKQLRDSGDYEEVILLYDEILEIYPDIAIIWIDKGTLLNALGRYEEALDAFETALKIDPGNELTWSGKGNALYGLGRYEEALAAFETALEINPDSEWAQKGRGVTLEAIEGSSSDDNGGGGCLIATAAFGSELAPQIQLLRELRNDTVLSTTSGTSFMTTFNSFYYSFSPTIADWERQNPAFKETVKFTITPLLSTLSILQYVDIDSEAEMLVYGIGIILLNIGMYFVGPAFLVIKLRSKIQTIQNKS